MHKLRIMTPSAGTVELHERVLPIHANHHGTLFAGQAMQFLAKAAFLAGRSFAQREVVMAAVTGIDFLAPIPVGRHLSIRAWVSRVGRSSMTVCVHGLTVMPQMPHEQVIKAIFEMVAVDASGRPVSIDRSYVNQEAL